ncbi:hypothetical protein ACFL6U_05880 [Planctomycetota bacterium]
MKTRMKMNGHANRKNQDWISALVSQLDRRRAQVLLDATLVEVTKSDEFSFDLNIISSIPDLAATSGLMGPIAGDVTTQDIMDRLTASGRDRFIDMQSNSGVGTGFYGDKHVMMLLEAMDEKKYGRVLAKPKILVNDNEAGTITTKDVTCVLKKGQPCCPVIARRLPPPSTIHPTMPGSPWISPRISVMPICCGLRLPGR